MYLHYRYGRWKCPPQPATSAMSLATTLQYTWRRWFVSSKQLIKTFYGCVIHVPLFKCTPVTSTMTSPVAANMTKASSWRANISCVPFTQPSPKQWPLQCLHSTSPHEDLAHLWNTNANTKWIQITREILFQGESFWQSPHIMNNIVVRTSTTWMAKYPRSSTINKPTPSHYFHVMSDVIIFSHAH